MPSEPALLRSRPAPTVLTPHPGEAAALLGGRPAELNRDRPGAARRLAEATGCTVVLKGAATVVATPEGRIFVNPTGGPALASGGTGDVLLGMLAGLLAQGQPADEAAVLAAFLHGFAADRIAERSGPAGLLAEDLARELPAAAQALREAAGRPGCRAPPCGCVPGALRPAGRRPARWPEASTSAACWWRWWAPSAPARRSS